MLDVRCTNLIYLFVVADDENGLHFHSRYRQVKFYLSRIQFKVYYERWVRLEMVICYIEKVIEMKIIFVNSNTELSNKMLAPATVG